MTCGNPLSGRLMLRRTAARAGLRLCGAAKCSRQHDLLRTSMLELRARSVALLNGGFAEARCRCRSEAGADGVDRTIEPLNVLEMRSRSYQRAGDHRLAEDDLSEAVGDAGYQSLPHIDVVIVRQR